jgi:multiple sugar transport system permease protein
MSAKEAASRYTTQVTAYNLLSSDDGKHYLEATFLPDVITGDAYVRTLVGDPGYHRMFWNSVLITIPILLGQLVVSPLAAYGFETSRWRRKETLYFLYIIVMLMPMQLLMVPHYIAAETLGYNDTWWAIILPGIFAPFGTFLIRQQMKGMDKSLLEAARVEGASELTVFRSVVVPLIKPTMAALTALTFAECWNIVDQAVVFIRDAFNEPLSVYLSRIITDSSGLVFASACVYMFPAVLIFIMTHENLADGILLSAGRESLGK